ncbi:MAG: PilZ domain-containing protein [Gammaproteobacteria bacterium]
MGDAVINYTMQDILELNLSYIPFVNHGGLFVPTPQQYSLGDLLWVELHFPDGKGELKIEGKVVWISPHHALHHVLPGVGIQFIGENASAVRTQIESMLDKSVDTGGYTYGIMEESKRGS